MHVVFLIATKRVKISQNNLSIKLVRLQPVMSDQNPDTNSLQMLKTYLYICYYLKKIQKIGACKNVNILKIETLVELVIQ